jgi:hypothetical protein
METLKVNSGIIRSDRTVQPPPNQKSVLSNGRKVPETTSRVKVPPQTE